MAGAALMIMVPAKIWRPKIVSRYTISEYKGEDLDDILDYQQYGCCVYRNRLVWSDDSGRTDIILFNAKEHTDELSKDLKCDETIDNETKSAVTNLVKEYRNSGLQGPYTNDRPLGSRAIRVQFHGGTPPK